MSEPLLRDPPTCQQTTPQILSVPWAVLRGPCQELLAGLPADCVQTTITSPPYYRQKDYGHRGQLGWERSVSRYVKKLQAILAEMLRVTLPSGSCFLVIGDSFAAKSLQLVPQRVALAAAECGWTVRNDLIWAKSDAAPDGARDRWRLAHEHILFLTKKPRGYKFNADPIRVPHSPVTRRRWGNGQQYAGRKAKLDAGPCGQRFRRGKTFRLDARGAMPRDVLEFATARSHLDHFATFPPDVIERLLLAATDAGDVVLDPFAGTATTGAVCVRNGRAFLGIELNARYAKLARDRLVAEWAVVCAPSSPARVSERSQTPHRRT